MNASTSRQSGRPHRAAPATRTWRRPHRRQRGASLVEVLVAVSVLAVGLLGTTTLQLTSKRANLEARERVTATAIAQELAERMRLNAGQLAAYTNMGVGRTLNGSTLAAVDCSSGCTKTQMAASDLYQLEQSLAGVNERNAGADVGGLSSPLACISGPDGTSGEYSVAIAWRSRTKLSDPGLHTCGQGSGLYDTAGGAETDVYRRVLLLRTYIAIPI